MKKITDFLFSTRLMGFLVVIFAVAMAVATFVENDRGSQTAKALIYNARWFEIIMGLLLLNFLGNIFRYKLYRREKLPVLLFHSSFVIILLGAFVTRYFGFEGVMPIREGATSQQIISDATYVSVKAEDIATKQTAENEKEVLFGYFNPKKYSWKNTVNNKNFEIHSVQYIPNAKQVFTPNEKGKFHLQLVASGNMGRDELNIPDGDVYKYHGKSIGFNTDENCFLNFYFKNGVFQLKSSTDGNFMVMQTQQLNEVKKDSVNIVEFLKLYTFEDMRFVISKMPVKGEKNIVSATSQEKSNFSNDALIMEISSGNEVQPTIVYGGKNMITEPVETIVNGLKFNIQYGSKRIVTPFGIKLRDFQMERYPGSNSPSSYASEVSVVDNDKSFDFRIFMNHVLDYKGYRFYQSSFDPDEKGTVLSVNHDRIGTLITYFGYLLMSVAMFITLFWKGTRFKNLSDKLSKLGNNKTLITGLLILLSFVVQAQNTTADTTSVAPEQATAQDPHAQMSHNNTVNLQHAEKFGHLLIQDFQGRFKPVNTYALEALRKVYKKDTYNGLSAEQVVLSTQIDPYYWQEQKLIHVKPYALGEKICKDLNVQNGLASLVDFYPNGQYYLADLVRQAQLKKNMDRTATDKEIINLDERVNVLSSVIGGQLLQIYPHKADPNHKWRVGFDEELIASNDTLNAKMHYDYLVSLVNAVQTGNYADADRQLEVINKYQRTVDENIIPSVFKTELEVKYNHWNIFKYLMMFYMTVGFILLILAFVGLFGTTGRLWQLITNIFTALTIIGLLLHALGLGARWYVSGHAPWSNGYEAVVFVAFITIIAGLIFSYKKSKFIIAVAVIMASLLMGIAHGSTMNPEITNLVPVLKSYWLMIHVAVITSSYGFLGLGSILAIIVLLLIIIRTDKNKVKIEKIIDELTYVNEMTLTVGLFTLSIGTFLGGVWANESWGRYWSWDPKEVWSLISMMVYVFVLHMRMIPGLRGKFAFNLASLWSIATLIMTFFGVNFYLSGMHSYAAGDPIPVPVWIYFAVGFFVFFSIISYWRFYKFQKAND